MKTEKPDFDRLVSEDLTVTDNAGYLSAVRWAEKVWDQHVIPLQSRVSELERENKEFREWLEAYKKSNAEFMKSTTDQKFENSRLEKENAEIKKLLVRNLSLSDKQNDANKFMQEKVERLEKDVETLRDENLKTCPCKQDGEAIKNSTGE